MLLFAGGGNQLLLLTPPQSGCLVVTIIYFHEPILQRNPKLYCCIKAVREDLCAQEDLRRLCLHMKASFRKLILKMVKVYHVPKIG